MNGINKKFFEKMLKIQAKNNNEDLDESDLEDYQDDAESDVQKEDL